MAKVTPIKHAILSEKNYSADKPHYVYCLSEIGNEISGPAKVGMATNPKKRISSLQGGNPRKLVFCWMVRMASRDHALMVEEYCLLVLKNSCYDRNYHENLMSEWLDKTPKEILAIATRYIDALDIKLEQVAA